MATETTGLAERYAAALYDLAESRQALDAVAADLKDLRALIAEVPDMARLVTSQALTRSEQSKAILAILDQGKADDLTRRFVGTLADNRRLAALPRIITAFLAQLAKRRGEVVAEITSAKPLSQDQVTRVTEGLKRSLGAKVNVDLKVDASLIGGLVVQVGSKLVDHSLKTKLMRLRLAMKGVG